MNKWLTGPKTPGLIILEHELSDLSVQAFIDAYPVMKQNQWNLLSVAQLDGDSAYQNSDSSTANVTPMGIVLSSHNQTNPDGPQSSASSSAASPTSSSGSSAVSSSSSSAPSSTGAIQKNGASSALAAPHLAGWQLASLLASCSLMMLSTLVML